MNGEDDISNNPTEPAPPPSDCASCMTPARFGEVIKTATRESAEAVLKEELGPVKAAVQSIGQSVLEMSGDLSAVRKLLQAREVREWRLPLALSGLAVLIAVAAFISV